jgi:NADH-quinone oxidoreductase subunit M
MALNSLIIQGLLSSLIVFFLTKVNKKVGGFFTIIFSGYLFFSLINYQNSAGEVFDLIKFGDFDISFITSNYAWFFSMILLLTYFLVSFFNPYWMKKLINPAAYNLLFMLSMVGTLGVFYAKDFLTMFIFFEIVVWASLFIIPMGKSRKSPIIYYTISSIGSFSMLYAIFYLYNSFNTFDIETISSAVISNPNEYIFVFFLMIMAGLTKLGIFPFHTWLPAAHGSAPHTFSPVLSGGLVKVGGFIALIVTAVIPSFNIFSDHLQIMGVPFENYLIMVLGGISIVVGTLMAIKQDDAKKLIAYSTVSNSGYILIGIAMVDQVGFAGGLMHIFNHAMASGAMFLSFAGIAYRTGTTKMSELGGLIKRMPLSFAAYLIAIISLAGIPPMSGFASKWLIFQGLSSNGMMFLAFAAFFGSVGSFMYVFRPLSAAFLGQLSPKHKDIKEVPFLMQIPLIVMSFLTIFFGIFPGVMLKYIGKIQETLGIDGIRLDGTKIFASTGMWDSLVVTLVFGLGFVVAAILFFMSQKAKKVDQMDTYTSAEFIHDPDMYHYGKNYYASFENSYGNKKRVEILFDAIAMRVHEFGSMVKSWFFGKSISVSIFWITLFFALVYFWGDIV